MMSRRMGLAGLLSAFSGAACSGPVAGNRDLAGRWGGILGTGPRALRVILEIDDDQPVVLVSLDQGNSRIPATRGVCSADRLDVRFASVKGRLQLMLTPQGTLSGTWAQGPKRDIVFTKLALGETPSLPPPAPFGQFQAEVDRERAQCGAPALSGAYAAQVGTSLRSDEAVSGTLVIGDATPVTKGQLWHIGSITKSMTATLVARLVERGLLSWDMKLGEAFSDIAPNMLPAYKEASLAQLISGQSGMPTNIATADLFGHAAAEETPTQRRRVWTKQALAIEPAHKAGEGFIYPNNGYVLAGAL